MDENERYKLYRKLRFLITDDFENFRRSMRQMLSSMGAERIDMAANGNETIAKCTKEHYDVLICDFNLGQGKTGQQVLEALRHQKLLRHTSLFVLVTAETSREIVMGAREYHPDTYIIKPLTQAVLQKRMDALLAQRHALYPINHALDQDDLPEAIHQAEQLLQKKTRYHNRVTQILGDLYLQRDAPDQARQIYEEVLAGRELAWARMGLGRTAVAQGALDEAIRHFETLIETNPDYIEAYDALADALQRKGNSRKAQEVVEEAVGISPLAILRQKQLAGIAASNQDMETAADAWRSTVKLSDNSIHDDPENYLGLSRTLSELSDGNTASDGRDLADEALKTLKNMRRRFKDDDNVQTQQQLVTARIHAGQGRMDDSRKALESISDRLDPDTMSPEQTLDYARALYTQQDDGAAQQVLNQLAARCQDDPKIMQAIEELMDEPVSFHKKNQARTHNKEGIKAFENGELAAAADAFKQALELVPQHPALNLNLVQVMLKHAEQDGKGSDPGTLSRCERCLEQLNHLPPQHKQYKRYQFLTRKIADLRSGSTT
ncbi:tetratricopeptide repeat protein [Salicola sp. Rm-C-2C1-2]|uniref:tetratricopeptide repeat protein n=1 Tax=Salicola sp. Rm-C-2C1-2 TaxID=3141321 RepID=UPI0032E464B5